MGGGLPRYDRDYLGSHRRRRAVSVADQGHQQAIIRMDDPDDCSDRCAHSGRGAGGHCHLGGGLLPCPLGGTATDNRRIAGRIEAAILRRLKPWRWVRTSLRGFEVLLESAWA